MEFETHRLLSEITKAGYIAMLAAVFPGLGTFVAAGLFSYFSGGTKIDTAFWMRSYQYGYRPVVSQFAYVRQAYTKDYAIVPNTAAKDNATIYPF